MTTTRKTPPPPKGLCPAAVKLWKETLAAWDLDPLGLVHLTRACEAIGDIAEARALKAKHGLTTTDRWGVEKMSPWVAAEHQAAGRLRASLAALNLAALDGVTS